MFLTRISVGYPVFATMMMLAMVVVGAFSYTRLPIEQLPDVDFPVVAVVQSYPGATPEAVESDLIEPIEDAVSTLAGIDTIRRPPAAARRWSSSFSSWRSALRAQPRTCATSSPRSRRCFPTMPKTRRSCASTRLRRP